MNDETLSAFCEFVHSRNKRTSWDHSLIVKLLNEVIRLRSKYEGFIYEGSKADGINVWACKECTKKYKRYEEGDLCIVCGSSRC